MPRPLPPRGGLPPQFARPRLEVVDLAEERNDLAAAVARPGPALALLDRLNEADEALRRMALPLQDALHMTLDQSLKSLMELCPRERIFVALAGVALRAIAATWFADRHPKEAEIAAAKKQVDNKEVELATLGAMPTTDQASFHIEGDLDEVTSRTFLRVLLNLG